MTMELVRHKVNHTPNPRMAVFVPLDLSCLLIHAPNIQEAPTGCKMLCHGCHCKLRYQGTEMNFRLHRPTRRLRAALLEVAPKWKIPEYNETSLNGKMKP